MMTVDVSKTGEFPLHIPSRRQSRLEVRAAHHAREIGPRAIAGHQWKKRKPVFDEGNAKQWNACLKSVGDVISGENIREHLAVSFDVADDEGNIVDASAAREQRRDLTADERRVLVAARRRDQAQRIQPTQRFSGGIENEKPLDERAVRIAGAAKFRKGSL